MATMKTPKFISKKLGRHKTRDGAFIARMPAGFAGDVSRIANAKIEPCFVDPNGVLPLLPGTPVVVDATTEGVRAITAADQAITSIYGVVVRTYPTQNVGAGLAAGFGAVGTNGPIVDVLRSGYIMVPINGQPVKGAAVHIWAAASAGAHVLGVFEVNATGGSTIDLASPATTYQGGADTNGICELLLNV